MKKLLIDLLPFVYGRAAGYNEYVMSLLEGLSNVYKNYEYDITLCVRSDQLIHFHNYSGNFKIITFNVKNTLSRIFVQNYQFRKSKYNYDYYIFNANFAPVLFNKRYLLVTHDLNFIKYPKNFSWSSLIYRKALTKHSIKKSTISVAISKVVASEIFDFVKIMPEVIYNPVRLKTNCNIVSSKNILCASSLDKHKNITETYNACLDFVKLYPTFKIDFIGNWNVNDFPVRNFSENITIHGYVEEQVKKLMFENAVCIIAASKYEGFGMPYAEAMIANKALICCDIDIAREIVDKYAYFIKYPYLNHNILNSLNAAYANNFTPLSSSTNLSIRFNPSFVANKYLSLISKVSV